MTIRGRGEGGIGIAGKQGFVAGVKDGLRRWQWGDVAGLIQVPARWQVWLCGKGGGQSGEWWV